MGKGDQRTRKGKLFRGTFGKRRQKKKGRSRRRAALIRLRNSKKAAS